MADEPPVPDVPAFWPQAPPFGIDWAQHRKDHVTKVGIVMRTRGHPLLLPRALDSVAAQTFHDWHLIVVNHGGDPGPVEAAVDAIAGRAAGKIEVLHLDADGGMERASNAGLARLDAEFVAVHDDDDTWLPDFVARTVAFLDDDDHRTCGGVVTHCAIRWEEVVGPALQAIADERGDDVGSIDLLMLLRSRPIPSISTLLRSALFGVVGSFDEEVTRFGSWELLLRAAAVTEIGVLPEPLARRHVRVDDSGSIGADEPDDVRRTWLRRSIAGDAARLGSALDAAADAASIRERLAEHADLLARIEWRSMTTSDRLSDVHAQVIELREALGGLAEQVATDRSTVDARLDDWQTHESAALDAIARRLDELECRLVDIRTDTYRLRKAVASLALPLKPFRLARARWRQRGPSAATTDG